MNFYCIPGSRLQKLYVFISELNDLHPQHLQGMEIWQDFTVNEQELLQMQIRNNFPKELYQLDPLTPIPHYCWLSLIL